MSVAFLTKKIIYIDKMRIWQHQVLQAEFNSTKNKKNAWNHLNEKNSYCDAFHTKPELLQDLDKKIHHSDIELSWL